MPLPLPREYEKRDALTVGGDGEVMLRAPQVREASDDLGPGYDGYPLTWNTVDSYGTFFVRGAVKKSIKERINEIPVLWQHDIHTPIGRHIEMKEDKTGLFVRNVISDTVAGRDALTLLRDGVPLGLSFGFRTIKDRSATDDDEIDLTVAPDWAKSAPRNELRAIVEVAYWEDSPVTFASNTKANLTDVRSALDPGIITSLMDSMQAGTLTDEQTRQLEALVAAYQTRAEADQPITSLDDERARRNTDIQIAIALADAQGYLTGVA